jgi:Ca-activated chloride channel family protein
MWGFLGLTAALAALFAANFRWKARRLREIGDPAVLRLMVDPMAGRRQRLKAVLLTLASVCFAAALAGPHWGRRFQEVHRRGTDVVIAVDVSASMLAEDVKPNRLVQAKRELGLIIDRLPGDRVGLVAFAGTAFLQCPLTLDYGAARTLLDLIDTDLIPKPGTSLAAAVEAACDAFDPGSRQGKALILLTDGEDHSGRLPKAVERAREEGVRVFAVGFGSPQGEIIPLRDEQGRLREYKKDRQGQTVVSRLGEEALRSAAAATGGLYYRAERGEIELDRILKDIAGMEKKTLESRVYGQWEDRYRWPLAALFLLLLLEFLWPEVAGHYARVLAAARAAAGRRFPRRTWRGAAAAGLLLVLPAGDAAALGRAPLARRAYERGDYDRAAERYARAAERRPTDPALALNLGDALYRREDYQAAEQAFARAEAAAVDPAQKARGAYNGGNALFRQNKFAEAAERYKEALRRTPSDADAKHNLELALKRLQEQKSGGKDGRDGDPRPSEAPPAGRPKEEPRPAAKMSREDVERLLQSVPQQEKEARRRLRAPGQSDASVDQDW